LASQIFVRNEVKNEDCPDKHDFSRMNRFHYVYVLVSNPNPKRHYTGLTDDLDARLKSHNNDHVPHTAKYRPWYIETAVAFRSREKAAAFEKYVKSHSGRAFASKHF